MAMDYGSTIPSNCTIVNGQCDMGKSAIAAAENLHNYYGIPYNQIELTPMIGGNDTQDETFELADITELANYARNKGLRACTSGRAIATATARRAWLRRPATATARQARWASRRAS